MTWSGLVCVVAGVWRILVACMINMKILMESFFEVGELSLGLPAGGYGRSS